MVLIQHCFALPTACSLLSYASLPELISNRVGNVDENVTAPFLRRPCDHDSVI